MVEGQTEFVRWLNRQIEGDDARYGSIRDMARKTGVSLTTLRRLIEGDEPTLKQLKKLSDATHWRLEDLQHMAGILIEPGPAQDELYQRDPELYALLLKVTSNPDPEVRKQVYDTLKRILKLVMEKP